MTGDRHPTEPQRAKARDLFVRLRGGALSKRELQVWLEEDPAHVAAWAEVEALWGETRAPGERLAEAEAGALSVYLAAMDRGARRRRVLRGGTVAVLALAIGLGGLWLRQPHLLQDLGADYASARGERRSVSLPDGSRVLLDADSAIRVDMDGPDRLLRLLRGAASFEVTRSPRPFRVRFGKGEVTVHGTVFDVRLLEDGGQIVLRQGRVSVRYPGLPVEQPLVPGEQFSVDGPGRPSVEAVDLAEASGWQDGRFAFYRMRLGDLVATLERYLPGHILIPSRDLGDRRVSGSLDLDHPEAALELLRDTVGLTITRLPGSVRILRP